MPRPVVPIFLSPRRSSRARSRRPCDGRIRAALSASFRLSGEIASPFFRIASISASSAHGSTTTPLPMIDNLPGRATPEGSSANLYSTLPTTRVWPALAPPWKRTTTSARSDSQSTILPLPSSPHWAPTTATLAMLSSPPLALRGGRERLRLTVLDDIVATEAVRLGTAVDGRRQCRDGDPAGLAQCAGMITVGAERHQHAPAPRHFRQGAQDRVGVEGEAGRRFRHRRVACLVAPAAAQLAQRAVLRIGPGKKREADAAVVFETAVLDRIDRDPEVGYRRGEPVEHGPEPVALLPRPPRQVEPVEGRPGRGRDAGR